MLHKKFPVEKCKAIFFSDFFTATQKEVMRGQLKNTTKKHLRISFFERLI